jgi:predicted aspartyl protease
MRLSPLGLILTIPALLAVGCSQQVAMRRSATADGLLHLLVEKKYLDLETAVNNTTAVSPKQREFFLGILANRSNKLSESLAHLNPLLASGPESGHLSPEEIKFALLTVSDDYMKLFRYTDAVVTYRKVLRDLDSSLTVFEKSDIAGDLKSVELLQGEPAQTVVIKERFTVHTHRNAIGHIETAVIANGLTQDWILDTGANVSIITRSRAEQLGLKLSAGTTPVAGLGGSTTPCHMAMVPSLILGKAELRNVPVLVIDDKDFYIPQIQFQMEALLGYPELSALRTITFYADDRLGISTATLPVGRSASMFLDKLTPVVAAEDRTHVHLFSLDTGASGSWLTDLYWREHPAISKGLTPFDLHTGGAGGGASIRAYKATVILKFGTQPVTLHDVPVLTKQHASAKEYFYGNLGQDMLRSLRSYTFDFRNMRFAVNPE